MARSNVIYNRVVELTREGKRLSNTDPTQANALFTNALGQISSIDTPIERAKALNQYANSAGQFQDPRTATLLLRQGANQAGRILDPAMQSRVLPNFAVRMANRGDTEGAAICFRQTVDLASRGQLPEQQRREVGQLVTKTKQLKDSEFARSTLTEVAKRLQQRLVPTQQLEPLIGIASALRERGDKSGAGTVLHQLGDTLQSVLSLEPERQAEALEQYLVNATELSDTSQIAGLLSRGARLVRESLAHERQVELLPLVAELLDEQLGDGPYQLVPATLRRIADGEQQSSILDSLESVARDLGQESPVAYNRRIPSSTLEEQVSAQQLDRIESLATEARGNVRTDLPRSVLLLDQAYQIATTMPAGYKKWELIQQVYEALPEVEAFATVRVPGYSKDSPLTVGKGYKLTINISASTPAGLQARPGCFTAMTEEVEIDLTAHATGVVVEPAWRRIIFQPGQDSDPTELTLIATRLGSTCIEVNFYYRGNWLSRLQYEAEVVPAEKPPSAPPPSAPPPIGGQLGDVEQYALGAFAPFAGYEPVDVLLSIWRHDAQFIAQIFALEQNPESFPIHMSPEDVKEVNQRLRKPIGCLVFDSEDGVEPTESDVQEFLQDLATEGHHAFVRIFEDERARSSIQKPLILGRRTTIQIASSDFVIPWELLYPVDVLDPPYHGHFWGMNYIISRNIRPGPFRSPVLPRRPKLGLVADNALPAVQKKEVPFFHHLKGMQAIRLKELQALDAGRKKEGLDQFKSFWVEGLDLVHFACHAYCDDSSPSDSSIRVSEEFPITLMEMRNAHISLDGRPLVFLNACTTGNLNPLYTSHFATVFLAQGAVSVVATECDVPDSFAAEFAEDFYIRLLKGERLGSCLLATRQHFIEEFNNPMGLFYSTYGSSLIQVRGGGERNE